MRLIFASYPIALRAMICMSSICSISAAAQNLEINFADLQRPGKPPMKTFAIPGLAEKADSYMNSFNGNDSSERNAIAQRQAESRSSPGPSAGGRVFQCTVQCQGASFETGIRYSATSIGNDWSSARDNLRDIANKQCRASKPGHWAIKIDCKD
jgi:hypothetical protein